MQLLIRYDHWLPKRLGVRGIVLYPFVLFAPSEDETEKGLLDHEMVHVEQIRRDGVLRFYGSYLWQFLKLLAVHRRWHEAYRRIDYEVEAYARTSTAENVRTRKS